MVDVNAKYWPRIKPEYMEFFPPGEPDKVWNAYEEQQEDEILEKIDNPEIPVKIEGFILLIGLCLEADARPYNPHNHHPKRLWLKGFLMELHIFHPDFKYYDVNMHMTFLDANESVLKNMLAILTSIQNNAYIPLDDFTKARIRKAYKSYNLRHFEYLRDYEEVFGNELD
jgi:hypothetical protein